MNDTLVPTKTLAGYAARGEALSGGCRAHGCRRRCWVDANARYEALLAGLPLQHLERLFRCNRLDGCGFEFATPRPDQSVRLTILSGRSNARVKVGCRACGWTRLPRAEEVIAVLSRLRTGGPYTCVHAVPAALSGKPCPRCKAAEWSAEVVWLRTDTAIWRAKGEGLFEEMAQGSRAGPDIPLAGMDK